MKCPRCQHENRPTARYCEDCATPLDGASPLTASNPLLKSEVETLRRALTESRAQQTATSEILRIISRSPTDAQPVFDAIVESAARLCDGVLSTLISFDGNLMHLEAAYNWTPQAFDVIRRILPAPPSRASTSGRAILDRAVVHSPDINLDREFRHPELSRAVGFRSTLAVPMLQDGLPLGVIGVGRAEPGPFSDHQIALLQTFADQAVIAIENVRLFTELQEKNRALTQAHAHVTESLEQRTATSEILRVISSSPTDVQPIFDAIVRSASRLCGGEWAIVTRYDGELLHLAAQHNPRSGAADAASRFFPQVPRRGLSIVARALLDGAVVHVSDVETEDLDLSAREQYRRIGVRAVVAVPMVHDGRPIGVVGVSRGTPGLFSDRQVDLLRTFADQAVIAIENERLFNETKEALEQQTATSEILRVIASSPTDIQPVFEAIIRSAEALCGGIRGVALRLEAGQLHRSAYFNMSAGTVERLEEAYPREPTRDFPAGRAVVDGAPAHVFTEDAVAREFPGMVSRAGVGSILAVPLLREGEPIGALSITRTHEVAFTDRQIALLQTFADQAVIAIENVRLFRELQEKNEALTQANAQVTEALEQQTATSEILRVISRSQTNVQPVFDTIVRSAVRLCDGLFSGLYQFDGDVIEQVAQHNYSSAALDAARRIFPMRPNRAIAAGRAILERAVVHLPDVELDAEYQQAIMRAVGARSVLCVPMLKDGVPVGAIGVARVDPGPFSDEQIELLKTFADQAVIAIENVRLFKALEARTQDLTRSVGELRALGEVGQAISSTLDLDTVLETIVTRAAQLSGADAGSIYEYDERTGELSRRAVHNMEAEILARPDQRFRREEGALGQAVARRQPVQFADISDPAVYESKVRDLLLRFGYRALLAVPLVREDQIIGALVVNRKAPGEFPQETVALLTTFATQSALAIQNARLFREIADKSRQLEVASQHKSEFLANMSPRAADTAERCYRLLRGADRPDVWRAEREAG
jgi:two-component system, NtrC family, sensor kinase